MTKEINKIKSKVKRILKKNGVVKAGIFGSYARGEQTKESDIDILIEVKGRQVNALRATLTAKVSSSPNNSLLSDMVWKE